MVARVVLFCFFLIFCSGASLTLIGEGASGTDTSESVTIEHSTDRSGFLSFVTRCWSTIGYWLFSPTTATNVNCNEDAEAQEIRDLRVQEILEERESLEMERQLMARKSEELLTDWKRGALVELPIGQEMVQALLPLGYPIFFVSTAKRGFQKHTARQITTLAACTEDENHGSFVTLLLKDTDLGQSSCCYHSEIRELFEAISKAMKHLVNKNQAYLKKLTGTAKQLGVIDIRVDIKRFQLFSCVRNWYPNLYNAFALYEGLRLLSIETYEKSGYAEYFKKSEAEINAMHTINPSFCPSNFLSITLSEHCYINVIIELLKPYADAFLLFNNEKPKAPLRGHKITIPHFLREEYEPRKEKIRLFKEEGKRLQSRRKDRGKSFAVGSSPGSQEQSNENVQRLYDFSNEQSSPDVPLQIPTHRDAIESQLPLRSITSFSEVVNLATGRNNDDEEESEENVWKEKVAIRRAQAERDRKELRQQTVDEYKQHKAHQAKQGDKNKKNAHNSHLLALYSHEQERLLEYLTLEGITEDPIYKRLLNPQDQTSKVTQDDLDRLFINLCDCVVGFLDAEHIGSEEDRAWFVQRLRHDLLYSRHNLHNTSEGENLPPNYITHRIKPLIYGGILAADSFRHGGKDARAAQEQYYDRLLERAFWGV